MQANRLKGQVANPPGKKQNLFCQETIEPLINQFMSSAFSASRMSTINEFILLFRASPG